LIAASAAACRRLRYTRLVRSFACANCGHLVFFENSVCLRCSTPLAFVASRLDIVALTGARAAICVCARTMPGQGATGRSSPVRADLCAAHAA
jgi:hypothetical protein